MAGYGNFQSDNKKYTNKSSRVNKFNPDFMPQVEVNSKKKNIAFIKNLDKWCDLVAYLRWMPDIFFDLITPETGGIKLDLDQRILLRCLCRNNSTYSVFCRGYGKSMEIVMAKFHIAIFYPNSNTTVTAQTRENAAKILREKYEELIRFYPMLKEEVYQVKFSNDTARIELHNGSTIDILANHENSKGARKHQGDLDEDHLTNEETFLDALEPIFCVPRRTQGKIGVVDPYEGNGRINFFTSAGFRGTSAFYRALARLEGMENLNGNMFLGAGWKLPAFYGRGETVASILDKKSKNTAISFSMNYESHWVGSTDESLLNVNKLLACRVLDKAEYSASDKGQYVLGIDVARSDNEKNCKTIVSVLNVIQNKKGRVKDIDLVNMYSIEGRLDYEAQAIEIKRIKKKFNAKVIVVDDNGLSKGIADELVKEHIDVFTGEILESYDTFNSERVPETPNSERCVYCYLAQSNDYEAIPFLMTLVETQRLRLLVKKSDNDYSQEENDNPLLKVPYIQTEFLIEELINLKLKTTNNGKLTVERLVTKIPKDRYSALLYGLWYVMKFMDNVVVDDGRSNLEVLSEFARIF